MQQKFVKYFGCKNFLLNASIISIIEICDIWAIKNSVIYPWYFYFNILVIISIK